MLKTRSSARESVAPWSGFISGFIAVSLLIGTYV